MFGEIALGKPLEPEAHPHGGTVTILGNALLKEPVMTTYTHTFVETYDELIGFGLDRETDESTIICYLQMFSDDALIKTMVKRMTDEELETMFTLLTTLMKRHLTENEYHRLFLKDDHHE